MVIGDVMIDAYIWGKVSRISPEAPVPIINISKRDARPGGAANVALNLRAMGAKTHMIAVIGDDLQGVEFLELMKNEQINIDGVVKDQTRSTTVKTRIISQGQQMLRVDEEQSHYINPKVAEEILQNVAKAISSEKIDAIVLEDYNKGLLSEALIQDIIKLARKSAVPVTVDPKKENFFSYKGATLFKPNLKELVEGLKIELDPSNEQEVLHALEVLRGQMNLNQAMVTLSEHGVQCLADDYTGRIPAHRREISDVSGAGDTVIAVATLCLAKKLPSNFMCELANLAGGLVCEEIGVVPIKKEKLLSEAIRVIHA